MISFHLELLAQTRANFLNLIEGLSLEQICTVPEGRTNNILWNLGHVVVTQQILCYKLSGLPMNLPVELIEKYRKGSTGQVTAAADELAFLKDAARSLVEKTKSDYIEGIFKHFEEYPTSYGIKLHHIEEALTFNNTHEGVHFGLAMAIAKQLS